MRKVHGRLGLLGYDSVTEKKSEKNDLFPFYMALTEEKKLREPRPISVVETTTKQTKSFFPALPNRQPAKNR